MKQFLESQNFLRTIVAESEKNSETAQQLFSDLTEAQLNWKPAPDRWSIAQCLDHLAISSRGFDRYFTVAIDRARRKSWVTNAPTYKPTFVGGWLARQLHPETGRNLPAPKVFRPADSSDIKGALDHFLKQQGAFLDFVRQTDGIDYNKTRLRSPVTLLMRYSLADAFVITVVHGRRHLAQARRVREMAGFPIA